MADFLTEQEYEPAKLPAAFVQRYGGNAADVAVFSAPARINIIGEHIDYNGGKVFPAAINRYLYVAIRKRTDGKIHYNDVRFSGSYEFDINDDFAYDKANDYANYLNGIVSQMKARGCVFPCGFDVLVASNVPAGGGISSSSALECGFAFAVSETFGFEISRVAIAKLGQKSEHDFMGVQCGIMDQFIIATARRGYAEMLDCATLDYEYAPLELGDYRFVVMNTNKVRKLADSKYNERRAQCEQALSQLQAGGMRIQALCDLTPAAWKEAETLITDTVLRRRVHHCVFENQRVLDAVTALKAGDLAALGALLSASHQSLKEDYEVTGLELDTLAETAQVQEGCLGARMTGAGFGGCAIALVHKDWVARFIGSVQQTYTARIGYNAGFFACESGDGVARVALQ